MHASEPVLLVRMVLGASPAEIAAVRKRLYDVVHEIRAEFECDDAADTLHTEDDRWAMTLAFTPVWPRRQIMRGS